MLFIFQCLSSQYLKIVPFRICRTRLTDRERREESKGWLCNTLAALSVALQLRLIESSTIEATAAYLSSAAAAGGGGGEQEQQSWSSRSSSRAGQQQQRLLLRDWLAELLDI